MRLKELTTRAQQIHRLHPLRQPLERRDRTLQQPGVRGERHGEAQADDHRLFDPDRRADRHRRDDEQDGDEAQQPDVDREGTPVDG
jgi:hypothetical protein